MTSTWPSHRELWTSIILPYLPFGQGVLRGPLELWLWMSIILRFGQGVLHSGPLEDRQHVGLVLGIHLLRISQGGFQEDLRLEALGLPRDLLWILHHKTLELASTFGIRPPRSRLFYVGCWNLIVGFTAELEVDISRCNWMGYKNQQA